MSLRPASVRSRTTGAAGAAWTTAAMQSSQSNQFEKTLVKQAIEAHMGNIARRLKREPISQVNPFLVGRQSMIIDELKGGGGGGGGPPPQPPSAPSAPDPRIQEAQDAIQKLEERLQKMSDKRTEERDEADKRIKELKEELSMLEKRIKQGEQFRSELENDIKRVKEGFWKTSYDDFDPNAGGTATTAAAGQAADIAQVNPWLVDFRNRLMRVQEEALKDHENLHREIDAYQAVIQELRKNLTQNKDEGDAARMAQIEALNEALEEEKRQVQVLMKNLERESARAEQFETQWGVLTQQLQDAQQDLQKAEEKNKELEKDIIERAVKIAVTEAEIKAMKEDLVEAERMNAETTAEREALKTEVDTSVQKLSDMKKALKECEEAAEEAQSQFREELVRNKILLEELQTRRETLEKETENLERLTNKDAPMEKRMLAVSGEI